LEAEPAAAELAVAKWYFRQVGRWAAAHDLAEPRLLDVGCGAGLFLRQAQTAGWQARGIEPSASAVAYARGRFGLEIHLGTLADAPLAGETFDIITLWHVLEHTPDPVATLRQGAGLLAPGGMLLVAVPNFGSLEALLFGRRWYSLDAPRHLYDFVPATLEALLAKAGLAVEHVAHSPGSAGFAYSVMGDLTGVSVRLRGRHLSEKVYARALAGISRAASPFCGLAARAGRGGALEVYARKDAP
ncbi:MAG: class I SAM-dependent methyltransferase, partial [Chloroflexota bacterium]